MKSFSVILIIYFITNQAMGQTNDERKVAFNIGYFGETITHAGMNFGIEYYPHQTNHHQMILAGNIGGYIHVRNNKSFFVRAQWGQRLHFKNGLFLDQFLGLGYLNQFLHGGAIYKVKPNGAVVETPDSGQSMVMPSISLGIGYNFSKNKNFDMLVYVRPELFWKAPFNGYYLTNFALNLGVIINPRK